MEKTKTKIICTLGPASSSKSILHKMASSGMAVARLNFSHGSHPQHQKIFDLIHVLNKETNSDTKVLQDLEGYRIRLGAFSKAVNKEITIEKNQILYLISNDEDIEKGIIPFDYQGEFSDIGAGKFIHIDDGTITLKVLASSKKTIKTKVVVPGLLKQHKGVNIPDVILEFKGVTQKDCQDLKFGLKNKVDFVAQSFVRNADDVGAIRQLIDKRQNGCQIVAKIENREGVVNIDSILDVADGIMVARGDMGVSLAIYEVPMIQKMIIKKCRDRGKFAIVATQMLESMTEHLRPTRAEVSDVANAILDGSDYVMLSAETAAGKHPVQTVEMMHNIVKFTEGFTVVK